MAAAHDCRITEPPEPRSIWSWLFRDQRAVVLLSAFILINDLVFLGLHVNGKLRETGNVLLYLDTDRGYAEVFQYFKFVFLLLLLLLLAVEWRSWRFAAWMPLTLYLLLDDALQLHERGGRRLAELLSMPALAGLRPQDLGELAVTLTAAVACFIPILVAYLRVDGIERWVFRALAVLVFLLAAFGIGGDVLHVAVTALLPDFDWLGTIEDGGETVIATAMLVFLLRLNLQGGRPGLEETRAVGHDDELLSGWRFRRPCP